MHITYACPRCEKIVRRDHDLEEAELSCPHCDLRIQVPRNAYDGRELTRCLVCPCDDLYIRKDFPQRVGVTIVAVGFVLSCIPWHYGLPIWTYAILFGTALLDVILYRLMGNALACYSCGALYRDAPGIEKHGAFQLETHERYRQQAARLAQTPPTSDPIPPK